jgi:hypothetical protein
VSDVLFFEDPYASNSRLFAQTLKRSTVLQLRPSWATMSLFSFIRSVYSLDTLDTRFTSDAAVPYVAISSNPIDPVQQVKKNDPPPGVPVIREKTGDPVAQASRWRTPEFFLYYVAFIITVPYMFWVVYDVSRRKSF